MVVDTSSGLYCVGILAAVGGYIKYSRIYRVTEQNLPCSYSLLLYILRVYSKYNGSQYGDWVRAERSGDRIPMGARFSAPVQTDPGAHPASCTMGTGSFPGVKSGRSVMLTPHPVLVPWSWKDRAIPLLPYGPYGLYRASVPVQGWPLPLPLFFFYL